MKYMYMCVVFICLIVMIGVNAGAGTMESK